jgi:hypothetical protein
MRAIFPPLNGLEKGHRQNNHRGLKIEDRRWHDLGRADSVTPAAYLTSARTLIRSQQAVKSKKNAVTDSGQERILGGCGKEV